MLPSCILTFEELAVLDLNHCGSLEYLPKRFNRIFNLDVLLEFKLAKLSQRGGCRISELRSLTRLRTISLRLTQDEDIGDDEGNALIDLRELKFLTISCFDSQDDGLVTKLGRL
ncbi:hypothetical protein FXO37_04259 [Capsicum annuum]|nr:hypothetical protein FXO37_04259 [Capsicum annuum]